MNKIAHRLVIVISIMAVAAPLCACGKKPGSLLPPDGNAEESSQFPRTYPEPEPLP